MRLRRLREPRYLIGAILGTAYLIFVFVLPRRAAAGRRARGRGFQGGPAFREAGLAFGSTGLLLLAAVSWILPSSSNLLAFTEAETDLLFPAPVSRRAARRPSAGSIADRLAVCGDDAGVPHRRRGDEREAEQQQEGDVHRPHDLAGQGAIGGGPELEGGEGDGDEIGDVASKAVAEAGRQAFDRVFGGEGGDDLGFGHRPAAPALTRAREAPPSVLPDISPTGGEIGWPLCFRQSLTLGIGEIGHDGQSPHLWGRCPADEGGACVGGNPATYLISPFSL